MEIELTKQEFELINTDNFLPKNISSFFSEKKLKYNISDENASIIRDYCGDYLQEVGFDKNDNPTEKGLILENLIDKFYID